MQDVIIQVEITWENDVKEAVMMSNVYNPEQWRDEAKK